MENKKVIYLAAGHGIIETNCDVIYQDKIIKRDIGGCMLDVDLTNYDIIIATPPCNYWSRANPYYKTSKYALETKHLLIDILEKLQNQNKPFVIENVINKKRMFIDNHIKLYNNTIYFEHGRHCYFTNIKFEYNDIEFHQQFKYGGKYIGIKGERQAGKDVKNVLERFVETAKANLHQKFIVQMLYETV